MLKTKELSGGRVGSSSGPRTVRPDSGRAGIRSVETMTPAPAAIPDDRPRKVRWHVVYYLLAAFDVLTVTASLLLSFRLLGIYQRSVADNQEWASHLDEYAELQRLAVDVNRPGNDVFESHDVPAESERLARARRAFAER